jgi:N-methylhydantoinase B
MDDDAVEIGKRIPIRVRVIVKGDEMTIDLTEVSKQVRGFYNSGATTGHACAQVAYKCLTSATDYPINEGSFRPLKVVLTSGTIISAVKPAAMRWWMTFPMTIVDTIFKALEPVIPHRVIAGHHADLMVALLNGHLPKSGRLFITSPGPLGGGWGAKLNEDGVSATVCLNDGDTHNSPVEHVEAKYPVLVERQALRNDSGGPGRYRGGLGVEQTIQARTPITVNLQIDRVHCAPWGLAGGKSGLGNQVTLKVGNKDVTDLPNAKVMRQELRPGDSYTLRSGGGGGFGPPMERDPEKVAADVQQGYVSRESAKTDYGVIVDKNARLDVKATQALRQKEVGRHSVAKS